MIQRLLIKRRFRMFQTSFLLQSLMKLYISIKHNPGMTNNPFFATHPKPCGGVATQICRRNAYGTNNLETQMYFSVNVLWKCTRTYRASYSNFPSLGPKSISAPSLSINHGDSIHEETQRQPGLTELLQVNCIAPNCIHCHTVSLLRSLLVFHGPCFVRGSRFRHEGYKSLC